MNTILQIMISLLILSISLFSTEIFAFSIYSIKSNSQNLIEQQKINYSKETMLILIGGNIDDMGQLFLYSALSRGAQYKKNFPERQVLLITTTTNENKYKANNLVLNKNKWFQVEINEHTADGVFLSVWLDKFKDSSILSLDVFSHSNPLTGPRLESDIEGMNRIENPALVYQLKKKMSSEGYVFLHGCNSGWVTAPMLSEKLNIPVAGALTGTLFYSNLKSDNFTGYESTKYIDCKNGSCFRMQPQISIYNGLFGKINAGLGVYKFFCNLNKDGWERRCYSAMAKSLFGFSSIYNNDLINSKVNFKNLVLDFFCSNQPSYNVDNCKNQFLSLNSQTILTTKWTSLFSGKSVECNFYKCFFEFTTETSTYQEQPILIVKDKTIETSQNGQVYSMEFMSYLKGYEFLLTK